MDIFTKSNHRQGANWDKDNLVKNYAINIFTQFGSALVAFFIVWIISRYKGTEVLSITVAVTAGSQAILLFSNWTAIAVLRLGTEEFIKTKKISYIFSARTVVLIFNLILLFIFYPVWSDYLLNLLRLSVNAGPFLLLQFTLLSIVAHFTAGFQAVKLLRMQGILLLADKCFSLLLILCFYFFYQLTWETIITAYLISSSIIVILSLYFLSNYISFRIEKEQIIRVLGFAFPLLPYTLTAFFTTNYLDAFFISKYLEKNDLGVYSITYQFYGFWLQLPTILGGLILPMFISYIIQEKLSLIEGYLKNQLHVLILVWTFCSTIIVFLLCTIIPMAFNIRHVQLNNIIFIFVIGTAFALPNLIGYSPYMLSKKIVFFSFPLALITAGTNFIGNYYLIPQYGLVGSAYSTILSMATSFIFSYFFIFYYFTLNTVKSTIALLPAAASILLCLYSVNIFLLLLITGIVTALLLFVYKNDVASIVKFAKERLNFKNNRNGV